MFSEFLTYFLMINKSEGSDTLLVTIVTPSGSDRMKSTRTLDLVFLRFLLRLGGSFDNVVDLINFLCSHKRKSFLDLDNVWCASILLGGLSIGLSLRWWETIHFTILEEFGDNINLLQRFGWDRRRKPFDVSWGWTVFFLIVFLRSQLNPGSELGCNFFP